MCSNNIWAGTKGKGFARFRVVRKLALVHVNVAITALYADFTDMPVLARPISTSNSAPI